MYKFKINTNEQKCLSGHLVILHIICSFLHLLCQFEVINVLYKMPIKKTTKKDKHTRVNTSFQM